MLHEIVAVWTPDPHLSTKPGLTQADTHLKPTKFLAHLPSPILPLCQSFLLHPTPIIPNTTLTQSFSSQLSITTLSPIPITTCSRKTVVSRDSTSLARPQQYRVRVLGELLRCIRKKHLTTSTVCPEI